MAIRFFGCDQYEQVGPGDIVWVVIVTAKDEKLFLVSRIEVGEIIRLENLSDLKEGEPESWIGRFRIIARQGSEQPFLKVEVTALKPEFRFASGPERLPSDDAQSFRKLRRLTSETAKLFSGAWSSRQGTSSNTERTDFDPRDERDAREKL